MAPPARRIDALIRRVIPFNRVAVNIPLPTPDWFDTTMTVCLWVLSLRRALKTPGRKRNSFQEVTYRCVGHALMTPSRSRKMAPLRNALGNLFDFFTPEVQQILQRFFKGDFSFPARAFKKLCAVPP